MKTLKAMLLLTGLWVIAGCGGATTVEEATGNANTSGTREVTGTLPANGSSASMRHTADMDTAACLADTVIATDTNAETSSTEVAEDCSFGLTLAIGKTYVISFLMDDAFVATLIFDSGIPGFTSAGLPLSDGDAPLDLGTITVNGNVASPEHEPLGDCDYDGDGEDDLSDTDDDEDGIDDAEELDCDLNGVIDDHDDFDCEDGDEWDDSIAYVLSVKPYDDPDGDEPVDLEREVKARIDCEVDQATVTEETFYVVSNDGSHTVACRYEFSSSGESGSKIECDHDDFEDFLPDTVYIAVIDGVMCSDGRAVESVSWTWLTEAEDGDDGCYEDELDEIDEEEDETDDEDEDEEDEDDDDEDENDHE